MKKKLLLVFYHKQETHRRWQEGYPIDKKYREVFRVCRNEKKKVKDHLELILYKDVKDSKKGYFKYINNKRRTKEKGDCAK